MVGCRLCVALKPNTMVVYVLEMESDAWKSEMGFPWLDVLMASDVLPDLSELLGCIVTSDGTKTASDVPVYLMPVPSP